MGGKPWSPSSEGNPINGKETKDLYTSGKFERSEVDKGSLLAQTLADVVFSTDKQGHFFLHP